MFVANAGPSGGSASISVLSPTGSIIATLQLPGSPSGQAHPVAMAAIGDHVYVVDQGRSRIVKLDTNGNVVATWGSQGQGDGQFDEPTAVAVDTKRNRVYVGDPHHGRIQVFDTKGTFLSKWTVSEWQSSGWSFQDLWFDAQRDHLYAISPATDEILVFDEEGKRLPSLKPKPPAALEGASALTLLNGKLYVVCAFGDRVVTIDLPNN